MVDCVAQLADFIVMLLMQDHAIASLCNLLGGKIDLFDRLNNRGDKVAVGQCNHQNHNQRRKHADHHNHNDLPLHRFQRGNIPYRTDQILVGVVQRTGNRHNPLARAAVPA